MKGEHAVTGAKDKTMIKGLIKIFCVYVYVQLLFGCASTPDDTVFELTCVRNGVGVDSLEIADECREKLPVKVAILPFINETSRSEARTLIRQGFYRHFSSKRYRDVELYEVDDILVENGLNEADKYLEVPPKKLGKILQADGLLYGKITGFNKMFFGLYSNVYVELEVKLVDANTGKILWIAKHKTTHHEGDIPLELLGIISAIFRTSMHLSDEELLRTVDDLCRTVVAALPEPEAVKFVAGRVMTKYSVTRPITFCP